MGAKSHIYVYSYMLAKELPPEAYTHTGANSCVYLDISEQLKSGVLRLL